MRRALAVLALILVPDLAQPQAEQARLFWDAPAGEGAEALVVIRSADGGELIVERIPVAAGAGTVTVELPPLPRAAETVQGGIVTAGRVDLQSTTRPVSDRIGNGLELRLLPELALGFHDLWMCDNGQSFQITQQDGGATLDLAGQVWALEPQENDATRLNAGDLELRMEGNEAILSLPGLDAISCEPRLFRPVLPLQATARDGSWRVDISLERAMLGLPDSDDLVIPAADMTTDAARDGVISLRTGSFSIDLNAGTCFLRERNMPYPLTARLALDRGPAPTEGCAGSPLQLIAGPNWFVTSIFGLAPEAVGGSTAPEMTLQIAEGQISGRGTCNRYVGRARIVAGRVSFADLGTTRLACPLHKQNLELRFLDALEVTTGFELSPDGLLILRVGHMPVLTARQR